MIKEKDLKIIKEISIREIKKLQRKIVKTNEDNIMIEKYKIVLNNIDIIKIIYLDLVLYRLLWILMNLYIELLKI